MRQLLTPRRLPATLLVIVLLAAGFSVVTAERRPALAATLPLGTVTPLPNPEPQPLPGASRHQKFRVDCSTVAVDHEGYYAVLDAIGTYRGTVLFFSGGGGNFYWSKGKPSAVYLVNRLREDGFRVLQVRWVGGPWEDASMGEQAGAGVACRPASIIKYLRDTEYPAPPSPVPGICGFCIAGPSGGSAQVSYALSHFGLDTALDGVFPLSGPTHAAIAKGCSPNRRWVQYRYDGISTRRIDGPFGFVGSTGSGPFAAENGPCRNRIESWTPQWNAASIDIGGGDYVHPTTRVHVVMGQLDKVLRAHGNDYRRALEVAGSPWVGYELVPGMGHGITEYNPGGGTSTLEDYPGLLRLWNGLRLTDPTKLPACNNGHDDDGDGAVDLADTSGCTDALDASELGTAVCDDGVDQDGDGRLDHTADDFGDLGCASTADADEQDPSLQCDDGLDNDGDGRTDFPADPACVSPADQSPLANPEKQITVADEVAIICDDGVDNDGDGRTDYLANGLGDPDCLSPEGTSEFPTVSIADPLDEFAEGGGSANFAVVLSSPVGTAVVVSYSTANGTAIAPGDYSATTASLTFPANSTGPLTASVPLQEDQLDEADETFSVNLSIVSGPADVGDGSATATIQDDDSEPSLSVSGQTVSEGAPAGFVRFTVTLTPASGRTVSVSYSTANGTALAPADYTAQAGVLTFTEGQTTKTVDVPVVNDTTVEPSETFTLSLNGPTGATIAPPGSATGTITNDDVPGGLPTITISDKTVLEPDTGGTVAARFTVTLSTTSSQTVTVTFTTANGTALSGSDYKAKNGTITFTPGQKSKTVSITVMGDVADEPNETFFVNLTNPVNATIADAQGVGTITNDD